MKKHEIFRFQTTLGHNDVGASERELKIFTLIELLLVIAIIVILASLLLPALNTARDRAKLILCLGQMKQVGLAMNLYIGDFNDQMPPATYSVNDTADTRNIYLNGKHVGPGLLAKCGYFGGCNTKENIIGTNRPKILHCPLRERITYGGWDFAVTVTDFSYARDTTGNRDKYGLFAGFGMPCGKIPGSRIYGWCVAGGRSLTEMGLHCGHTTTACRLDGGAAILKYSHYYPIRNAPGTVSSHFWLDRL